MPSLLSIDLPNGDHAALARRFLDRTHELMALGDRMLTWPVAGLLDEVSRRWAAQRDIPYKDEIARIDAMAGRRGAWFASLNYEWGCAAAILDADDGTPILGRVLDWPFPRLGEMAMIVNSGGPAGNFSHVTWPGCVGALQASAPGRFAAVLNNAPHTSFGLGPVVGQAAGWLADKKRWWRSQGMPPALLLRQVCETAPDFAAARHMLKETALCRPCIFTIVGVHPGEHAVIQRSIEGTAVNPARAVTNHWLDPGLPGDLGPNFSERRLEGLRQSIKAGDYFRWLQPPVLNAFSRLAVEMHPASGMLRAQGWDGKKPATALFESHA
ncbi:MAG: hypothetical protein WDO70_01660 [Alphaproteobacteria bacterium]